MRSRMVLLLADGVAYQKIQDLLDTTAPTIARWKRRFLQHRIAGLMEELHLGQQQGTDNKLLFPDAGEKPKKPGNSVECRHRLGGLLKYYGRAA